MTVNLTENRFLQQVQKIELMNWDWLGIHYATQRKPPSKNVQLWQYLAKKLSFIFEFELVPFDFSLIWENLSWCLFPPKVWGGGTFFKKNPFHVEINFVGQVHGRIVLHEGTNDQIYQQGRSFTKCISQ